MMEKVNVYIKTSNRSPQKQDGTGYWLLECIRNETPKTIEGAVKLENVSAMQAELITTLTALRRLNTTCELTIYQSGWVQRVFEEGWINRWANSGWIARNGKPVEHKEEWLELARIIFTNICEFKLGTHTYSMLMETQIKKEMEKNV